MSEKFKDMFSLVLISALVCIFGVVVVFYPDVATIIVSTNTTYEDWLDEFRGRVMFIGTFTLLTSLIWHILTGFIYKITSLVDTNRRFVWISCFFSSLIISILTVVLWDSQIQEGKIGVYFILILYAILGYYIPTVFLTPSSYKYAPIGAEFLRGPSKRRRGL